MLGGVDVLNFDAVTDVMAKVRPRPSSTASASSNNSRRPRIRFSASRINSLLPHRLHRLCQASGARLIHFSTDCVFSGRTGNYTEDDPSDALDLYGRSKFLGETLGEGALTIRTSIIGRELRNRQWSGRVVSLATGTSRRRIHTRHLFGLYDAWRWLASCA